MDKRLYEIIDNNVDEYFRILRRWVRIPSVAVVSGSKEEPLGHEIAQMKAEAEKTMRDMGISVVDATHTLSEARFGNAGESIVVMGHLDVVDAGEGWHYPPYDCTEDNGRLYGRGVLDDKGGSLAAVFALQALKRLGVPWKNNVRLLLGYNEELGDFNDIYDYLNRTGFPEICVCVDSVFPFVRYEYGIFVVRFSAPAAESGLKIEDIAI